MPNFSAVFFCILNQGVHVPCHHCKVVDSSEFHMRSPGQYQSLIIEQCSFLVRREPEQAPVLFIFQNPYATFGSLLNLSYSFIHGKTFDLVGFITYNPDPY